MSQQGDYKHAKIKRIEKYTVFKPIFQGYMYNTETKEILDCNWKTIGKVKQGKIYWDK